MTLNLVWSRTPDGIHSIPSFEFCKVPPPGPDNRIQNLSLWLWSLHHCTYFCPIHSTAPLFSLFLPLTIFHFNFFPIASPLLHAPAITTMAPNNTPLALNQGRARMLPILSKPNRWQVSKNLQKKEVGFLSHLHLTSLLFDVSLFVELRNSCRCLNRATCKLTTTPSENGCVAM